MSNILILITLFEISQLCLFGYIVSEVHELNKKLLNKSKIEYRRLIDNNLHK